MAAREHHTTRLRDRTLIDTAVEAYVEWREESASVWDAYGCWRSADAGEAGVTFWAYRAALEREEQAALVYARHMHQIALAGRSAAAVTSHGPRVA
jgi:hypothetical protein